MNAIHALSFGLGVGFLPASGTIGSLWGIALAGAHQGLTPTGYTGLWLWVVCALLWICVSMTYRACGQVDHKAIVADEIVGMLCALYGHELSWSVVVLAFVWFRFWDISKWGPVGYTERLPWGGHAVMLDDVVAGLLANICVWLGGLFQPVMADLLHGLWLISA